MSDDETVEVSEGTAPPGENKADRFVRLANARVTKALRHVSLIGNLVGPNYESTPKEREVIITKLRRALDDLEIMFTGSSADRHRVSFKLDEPADNGD